MKMFSILLASAVVSFQAAVPAQANLMWGQTATMDWTHAALVIAASGHKIYLIGDPLALHIYDTTTNTWSKGTTPPSNQYGPTVALNGKIYIVGGVTGQKVTGNCTKYDPSSDSWSDCASLPSPRGAGAAAVLNGKIHLVGGRGYEGATLVDLNDHIVYDPASDSWHSSAPMPTGRDKLSLVADPASGRLFAIGGFNSQTRNPSGKTEIYNSATKSWTDGADVPTPRFAAGSVLLHGLIYFMGGSTTRAMYPTVNAYNVSTNTWTTLGGLPANRPMESAVVVNGTIYATGGDLCQGDTCYKTNRFWTLKPTK
jgi:N-acetylneuraminic acid mutarotase